MIYIPAYIKAEHIIATQLVALNNTACDALTPLTDNLLHSQPTAVQKACEHQLSILTGAAGTGKTTTLNAIVTSFQHAGLNGFCCSPTGKAAKRANEAINSNREHKIRTGTIHKILGYNFHTGECKYNKDNKFRSDFIIIDEFSMCGVVNLADFMLAIDPQKTRLLLCGDANQLPSVSVGNIAIDVLATDFFQITTLDKIIRQDENSGIVHNATNVLNGKPLSKNLEDKSFKDFYFIETENDDITYRKIMSFITEHLPAKRNYTCNKPGSLDVQVLSPMKRGKVGTQNLNKEISATINPSKAVKHGFKVGDKVINKKNDYELMIVNGDVGIVKEIGQNGIEIDFGENCGPNNDGKVLINGAKLEQIHLANAYTIHSSQGSEYKCVIYPFSMSHWILHSRNLMYTGMTRAKEMDILVGSAKCRDHAIRNRTPILRNTALKKLLFLEHSKDNV